MSSTAFLFDLNGTMINDMAFHCKAWHSLINNDLGKSMSIEVVAKEMYGKNEEVLERIFGAGTFTLEQMHAYALLKEQRYQAAFLPHLQLINGLAEFLEKAKKYQHPMAIGSAAIMFNINFVLDNLHLHHYFSAIVGAEKVVNGKPNPEVFLKCAEELQVQPQNCVVFEDSPKGAEAALHAGMKCVAITTMHQAHEFGENPAILFIIDDYTDCRLNQLF